MKFIKTIEKNNTYVFLNLNFVRTIEIKKDIKRLFLSDGGVYETKSFEIVDDNFISDIGIR